MKHIYKKAIRILMIVLLCFNTAMLSACVRGCHMNGLCIERYFETDGIFKFYYDKEENDYAVVGLTEVGEKESELVVPAYFNGKHVEQMGYVETKIGLMGATHFFHLGRINSFKIYFPFNIKYGYAHLLFFESTACKVFFVNINDENLKDGINDCDCFKAGEVYVAERGYDLIIDYIKTLKIKVNKANTVYKFNYEGEPNEGYFFINEFETGGKIENTPYEPQREGYEFTGWYKEPECKNKWDFEKDTLPATDYEEDGTIKFKETALYAGWNKK